MEEQLQETDSYDEEIRLHRRWNFVVNASDLIAVNLAKSFIFSSTILTLYASYLTHSAILIGLIPAIQKVGYMLPQLVLARHAEGMDRKKPFVVKVSVLERLPYLVISLGIFLWPGAPAWFAYLMLAVNIAMATGAAGVATPAWKAMLGKVIDPHRRGLLFSLGWGVGGLFGIAGAVLSRHILATVPYPTSYGMCFLLSFVAQALSWLFLTLNREPARPAQMSTHTLGEYLRDLPAVMKGDPNFSRYLLSQSLAIAATMAASFYIIYGRRVFDVSDGFAGSLTLVALVAQGTGTPLLGWLSDRLGHKWLGLLSIILGGTAAVLMLFIPDRSWLFPVFVLVSLSIAGNGISLGAITMEFGKADRLPTFVALSGTLLGVPTLLAPLIGGWLLERFGFDQLFLVAILLFAGAWILLKTGVQDPRVRRT